jgi:dipeptidyl-peptidase-4
LKKKLDELEPVKTEFFRIDIGDGVTLDGWQMLPPHLDAKAKYPLLVHVYGEPAAQTVLDRWGGGNPLWHRMLAEQGYVVMSFDNRGTPALKGRAWRKAVHRKIGVLAPQEQAVAVEAVLKQRPYLDPKRVGVWGWSGGGSMSLSAIFKYPDLYQTAISIAPVANQRLYDTIYQERYMGLPGDNVEGFIQGSPITFAHQLKGNLLIIHGTGDDNCHYQGTEALINELIRHDKPFTMMAYPNRSHSINEGSNTTLHLRKLMTRYLRENLPPGPRPSKQDP